MLGFVFIFLFTIAFVIGGITLLVGKGIKEDLISGIGKKILIYSGVPLLLVTVLFSSCLFTGWNHARVPANVFKDVFDGPPPPDVTSLQSDVSGYVDSSSTYLKFSVPASTLSRLIANRWKKETSSERSKEKASYFKSGKPEWWNPMIASDTDLYVPTKRGKSFASEEEVLIYNRSNQTAYFGYVGID